MNNLKKFEALVDSMTQRSEISFEKVSELIDCFLLSNKEADYMRSLITEKFGRYLIGFTKEFSEELLTTKDMIWLKKSYALHLLEDCQCDYRENTRRLFYISYASIRVGLNKFEAWHAVEDFATEKTMKYIKPRKPLSGRGRSPEEFIKDTMLEERIIDGKVRLFKGQK